MPQTFNAQYVDDVFEIAKSEIERQLEGVDEAMGLTAAGMKKPTSEELAAFFFKQQTLFPPETFIYPGAGMACPTCGGQETPEPCATCAGTGEVAQVVTASPWILALEFCANGDEWLSRFNRFTARYGGI